MARSLIREGQIVDVDVLSEQEHDDLVHENLTTSGTLNFQDGTISGTGDVHANAYYGDGSELTGVSGLGVDYEEGTWIPVITFGGAGVGIVYGENSGYYVKVGKVVTLTGSVRLTSKGSSTGAAKLGGLPFPTATGPPYTEPRTVLQFGSLAGFTTITNMRGWVDHTSSATILLTNLSTAVTNAHFQNTSTINGISLVYITN
jgi:hypothetical protein